MAEPADDLRSIAGLLKEGARNIAEPSLQAGLAAVEDAASKVGKAWSGSWIGHHAYIYYRDLKSPPPGSHFSSEWGLIGTYCDGTRGDWDEYNPDRVRDVILQAAGRPDLDAARSVADEMRARFVDAQSTVVSVLEIETAAADDAFLKRLLEDVKKLRAPTASEIVSHWRPSGGYSSRDSLAMHQGLWTAPHLILLAEVISIRSPSKASEDLAALCEKAAAHLDRVEQRKSRTLRVGTNIFIGHGRSPLWKDLKDFLQDRLGLPWDEFNRVPVAGITNIARLSQMLDDAALAFVVLTAEDEKKDGSLQARMNVIHEVGLFQGRLGFTKAIVLLEDGCAEFSNIQGLGQIHFPAGNLAAVFEDIRQVLEREGVIES